MQLTVAPHVVIAVAVRVRADAEVLAEALVAAARIIVEELVVVAVRVTAVVALVHRNSFYVMDLIMEVRLAKT